MSPTCWPSSTCATGSRPSSSGTSAGWSGRGTPAEQPAPGAGKGIDSGLAGHTPRVRGYGQYCPIARGAEVLGDRWTLLIAREMLHGVCRFNQLERCLPGISRSVLAQRLRHLQKLGLVVRTDDHAHGAAEYHLTPAGRDLRPV